MAEPGLLGYSKWRRHAEFIPISPIALRTGWIGRYLRDPDAALECVGVG
jgi:hypothetical protein